MKNMNLKNYKEEDLINLKAQIDFELMCINNLKREAQITKGKNMLIELKPNDKIFCINFKGSEIYHVDYVTINFSEPKDAWINFNTTHETKPMGESASILDSCMYEHYFLSDCCSSMRFYTLKPERWQRDLDKELERLIKERTHIFNEEIDILTNNINQLFTNKELDFLINNIINQLAND